MLSFFILNGEQCFMIDDSKRFSKFLIMSLLDKLGGDSQGDRILIIASSRVKGNAGDGDLLETGDFTGGRAKGKIFSGKITGICFFKGSSFGSAISKIFSVSILILIGLTTFFPSDSLAFAAKPD